MILPWQRPCSYPDASGLGTPANGNGRLLLLPTPLGASIAESNALGPHGSSPGRPVYPNFAYSPASGVLRDVEQRRDASEPTLCSNKLADSHEAFLLHHYIAALASHIDICDPHLHFSNVVPELAIKSPVLLNAALAASARHLSRFDVHFTLEAEKFHDRCVELLIPYLDDYTSCSDEVIAATLLLRLFEQLTTAVTGIDSEQHLGGVSAFMNAENTAATAGGVRQAAFWIFVRQDLNVALEHQRPPKLELEKYTGQLELASPTDDWAWANRMVHITAEIAAYAFGPDRSVVVWGRLRGKVNTWFRCKPQSLQPLFVGATEPFPVVYYSRPWHGKFTPCVSEEGLICY